jgi:CRP-like cAMP-binding protein
MLRQVRKNHILASLPESVFHKWQTHFEMIDLPVSKIVHAPGQSTGHIHFPTSAIISWVYMLENGASTEVAMTGREGLIGLYQIMGAARTNNTAIVQTAGQAVRIRSDVVVASVRQEPAVQQLLFFYAQALITQISQVSVCHRHHNVDQQLCRMLLLTLDRQDSNTLYMTQELIASLLGVRREGVTLAASKLMKEGIIDYSRGRITVPNRAALEAKACECYDMVRQAYSRLRHMTAPMPATA